MKRNLIKSIAAVCALTLSMSVLSACSTAKKLQPSSQTQTSSQPQQPSEPVKLSFFSADAGRINKEDNPIVAEIEKKTNVKLEINLVPSGEFTNKFNLLVASGSVPDITRVVGYDLFQYIPQGAFLDIGKYVDQHGANLKKYIPKEGWDLINYKGKTYGVPNYNKPGKNLFFMRKDWLDKLGLKVPTNLNEFEDVLKKFTYNDPDGNGKNDTYGITTESQITTSSLPVTFDMVFGAFGISAKAYSQKDGKVYAPLITQEYKEALTYINKLFKEDKVVDPDLFILKTDQARQNLVQSRAGAVGGNWSLAVQQLEEQLKMKAVNPKAEWTVVSPIKGNNGQYGLTAASMIKNTVCIGAKCKNPEAAVKFLDYLVSDEGNSTSLFGLQNTHYTGKTGNEVRTPDGQKAMDEKWLDVLSQLLVRLDLGDTRQKVSTPQYVPYLSAAENNKLYTNLFEGISTPESQKLDADMKKLEFDWFVKFATGAEPISKFDDYIKQWKDMGGKERAESLLKQYNQNKGTNLTPGNW
jgi:putative aldouronate transport system substrate-binding protein